MERKVHYSREVLKSAQKNLYKGKEIKEEVAEDIKNLLQLLFKPHKTIRDAVHGDITVLSIEVDILDTNTFQRLHSIKQLGVTHLIYPCAKHARFEHSIGCLFMAQKIIELVNKNPYPDITIGPYDRLLIRLCALLHDVCYIPFGHTLEDEGGLFKSQWIDEKRIDKFLSETSEIGNVILNNEILIELNKLGAFEFNPKNVIKDIQKILIDIESKKVHKSSKPYICDIVGNTLCADLLDYIRRDLYFTGLCGNYDERFLSYLYLTKYENKPRLTLRLIKPKTGRVRKDVLSELLHLLRLRYSLAEKVYFHHTKISASAMIISAANDMLQRNALEVDKLYSMGDEAFLVEMKDKGTEISKFLMAKLFSRDLYKPVYGLKYSEEGLDTPEARAKKNLIEDLRRKNENIWKIERKLEIQNILKPGTIVVYCPGPEMGHKAVETLVYLGNGRIGPLEEISPRRVKEEIKSSIIDKHLELWSMYVFLDRSIEENIKSNIHGDCEKEFGLMNEIKECGKYHNPDHIPYPLRYEEKFLLEHPEATRLSPTEAIELAESIKTSSRRTQQFSEEDMKYITVSYNEYQDYRKEIKK